MKVRIASVGDIRPTKNPDFYFATVIALVEGQSELITLNLMVPRDKLTNLDIGTSLDVVPTPDARFSVRSYEPANGKASEIASKIDEILKGAKR